MENLEYAFLDENNIVVYVFKFSEHDEFLLNQVKEHFNLNYFISCSDFGLAHVSGDFYNNKFYPKKIYESWIRNEELGIWEPPISYPVFDEENPRYYKWNEEILNWEEIQVSE